MATGTAICDELTNAVLADVYHRMKRILDHCPSGSILDPVPESPPLTATEARRLMREAIQDLGNL